MAQISVFGIGRVASTPYVTAKSLTNMYVENRPAGEKSRLVGYRTPGLEQFLNVGDTDLMRGMHAVERTNTIFDITAATSFVVFGSVLYEVSAGSTSVFRGNLASSYGRVSMTDNGTQLMIVDGANGYIYNMVTATLTQITGDFPANPLTVTFLAGRFIVNISQSGRFYWSAVNDGTSWDALDFASAESSPDPIVAVWSANGQLILFGTSTTEFWGVSSALDSPFVLIQGTATEWGLAATWSVAKYDNSVAMLVKNRMGQVMVAQLAGYLPRKISTPDIDAIINSYTTISDASAWTAMVNGHPFYIITFPSAPATWLYDGSTSVWTQLKSYGLSRHRAEFGMAFAGLNIVADFALGRLYKFTKTALTDNGSPIHSEIVSEQLSDPDQDRLTVDLLRVDVQVGQGSVSVPRPQIGLSVSRDNGNTYGAEMMRDIGPVGTYSTAVDWTRLGVSRTFVFKWFVSDPFPFTLMNAMVNPKAL